MELSSNGRQGIYGCSMEVSFLCKIMVTGMWSDVIYPEPRFYPLDFTLNPKLELNVWVGPWWWFHPRQSNARSEMARPGCFRDHRGLNGRTAPEYGQVWPHNGPEKPETTRQGIQTTTCLTTICPRLLSWLPDDQGTTIWWRHRLSNLPLNLDLM